MMILLKLSQTFSNGLHKNWVVTANGESKSPFISVDNDTSLHQFSTKLIWNGNNLGSALCLLFSYHCHFWVVLSFRNLWQEILKANFLRFSWLTWLMSTREFERQKPSSKQRETKEILSRGQAAFDWHLCQIHSGCISGPLSSSCLNLAALTLWTTLLVLNFTVNHA